ncbi:MAG: bacteriohemerythrin [Candidatus Falkowbacteria bacterium]|nr:bacteriohemerythrin [Candidatus Falkowbacteria bacterium]
MSLIPWQESYSLGISEIDSQHQKMLGIINHLADLFENDKHHNEAEIEQAIIELTEYAIYHFQTEEKYFATFNYDKAKEHIEVHDQYREKVEEWRKRYNESKDPKIFFEISEFLQNWWIWHINNTDRAYAPLFREHGVN